jgi:hypothetical protein
MFGQSNFTYQFLKLKAAIYIKTYSIESNWNIEAMLAIIANAHCQSPARF